MARLKDPMVWFYGLLAATIGAFSGAVEMGIALPVIDVSTFNWGDGLQKLIRGALMFGIYSSVKAAVGYLKKEPLPQIEIGAGDTVVITKESAAPVAITVASEPKPKDSL